MRAHLDAARKIAGAEWASAANFFCSTEDQVAAMKVLASATEVRDSSAREIWVSNHE